jgi:diguanylate cyclase (GGDEF)-like protein
MSLSLRLASFIFAVCCLVLVGGDALAIGLPGWAIPLAAGVAGVVAYLWTRPLEAVVDAAHRLVAGEDVTLFEDRDESELRFLGRALDEIADQLAVSRRQLQERNHELERANEVLEQLSITDGLTRLHNHRHFQDRYQSEARRADRTGHPLCLVLIDIDDFKSLNDEFGHSVGDRVLASVARVMNDQIRDTDYLARYGGEEFAMPLPETTLEGGMALAEKLRLAVASTPIEVPGGPDRTTQVTVSLGVTLFDGDADRSFDAADRALYQAKADGKDCVVSSGPLT